MAQVELALPIEPVSDSDLGAKLQAEVEKPFDLEQGPLVRASLFRLSSTEHVLAVVMHHIVSDGWSMGVFVREVGALYAGKPLAALDVQYADYAAWQLTWLEWGDSDRLLAFLK